MWRGVLVVGTGQERREIAPPTKQMHTATPCFASRLRKTHKFKVQIRSRVISIQAQTNSSD